MDHLAMKMQLLCQAYATLTGSSIYMATGKQHGIETLAKIEKQIGALCNDVAKFKPKS